MVPCYNEEENVVPLSEAVIATLEKDLPEYDYEILFIDNCSKDKTREKLILLCSKNKKIKAIFNTKNFGQFNSPYYGLCQTTGDCTICLCADFQDPIDMIPKFVHEWENGYKIVCGIKTSSKENKIMYFLRGVYYKAIIQVLRDLKDPTPVLRGIVAELGPERKEIPYEQQERRAGKTNNNWYRLYDAAMLSFTSYTKIGLRLATFIGFGLSAVSVVIAIIYFILKLLHWNDFPAGMTPILLGVFVIGSMQLFFIGLLGEYIMNMNARLMNRPLVIEQERINFDEDEK